MRSKVSSMADGMVWDEAVEFFDFNIAGAWVGDNTPVIMDDC